MNDLASSKINIFEVVAIITINPQNPQNFVSSKVSIYSIQYNILTYTQINLPHTYAYGTAIYGSMYTYCVTQYMYIHTLFNYIASWLRT